MQEEVKMLAEYEDDLKWLSFHKEEIRKEYKNVFVAVKDKHVIGSSRRLDTLLEELRNKGIDPSLLVIKFMPEKDIKLILAKS